MQGESLVLQAILLELVLGGEGCMPRCVSWRQWNTSESQNN